MVTHLLSLWVATGSSIISDHSYFMIELYRFTRTWELCCLNMAYVVRMTIEMFWADTALEFVLHGDLLTFRLVIPYHWACGGHTNELILREHLHHMIVMQEWMICIKYKYIVNPLCHLWPVQFVLLSGRIIHSIWCRIVVWSTLLNMSIIILTFIFSLLIKIFHSQSKAFTLNPGKTLTNIRQDK